MKPVLYLVRALPGQDLEPLRPWVELRGGGPTAPPREHLVEEAVRPLLPATCPAS